MTSQLLLLLLPSVYDAASASSDFARRLISVVDVFARKHLVITSAEEVMFCPASVCSSSFCLSVCVLATSLKTTDHNSMKFLPENVSLDKKRII